MSSCGLSCHCSFDDYEKFVFLYNVETDLYIVETGVENEVVLTIYTIYDSAKL